MEDAGEVSSPVEMLEIAVDSMQEAEQESEAQTEVATEEQTVTPDDQPNAEIIKEIISLSMDGQEAEEAKDALEAFWQNSMKHTDIEVNAADPILAREDVQHEPDPKNAQIWNELGNVYYNSGAYEEAAKSYKRSIELDDHFAWPYSNLALAYVQMGELDEAVMQYQRSIELFSNDADKAVALNRLGNVYRRQNDYDKAISSYQQADDLDPDNSSRSLRSRFSLLGSFHLEQAEALG